MQLLSFISNDPLANIPRIWTEYLPNDPFCQQSVKEGREKLISKYTRCEDCRMIEQVSDASVILYMDQPCNVHREFRSKPKFKYYGSMEGRMKRLLQQIGDIYLLCCPETETNHHYIGLDSHTLSIISNLLLEQLIPDHCRSIERVYRCQDRITTIRHTIKELTDIKDIDQYRKQLHNIMDVLSQARFNMGSITYNTITITDKGLNIDHVKNSSFDINNEYRLGPILDDLNVPSLDIFSINRYPEGKRHYFRLITSHEDGFYSDDYIHTISKYGIPVVGKAIDYYRCIIILIMKCSDETPTATSWFREMFLPSEHQRVMNRIRKMQHYITHNEEAKQSCDLIHCLYDHEGPFSLRCDVHKI